MRGGACPSSGCGAKSKLVRPCLSLTGDKLSAAQRGLGDPGGPGGACGAGLTCSRTSLLGQQPLVLTPRVLLLVLQHRSQFARPRSANLQKADWENYRPQKEKETAKPTCQLIPF